jgi:DNA-binding NarL/FixJ family response regulator
MAEQLRLLIVEDEAILALAIEKLLTNASYTVCGKIASGERAIEAVRLVKPDIILMDIRLAGQLDGIDAAYKIRDFSETPIIFMTGYQDNATRERAIALRPRAFLTKPVGLYDLKPILDSVLNQR